MNAIDKYFSQAIHDIEEKKFIANIKANEQKRKDGLLCEKIKEALYDLGTLAKLALQEESEFVSFMIEKLVRDDYDATKHRMIISVVTDDDIGISGKTKWWLYIELKGNSFPKKLADLEFTSVSFGYRTSACGRCAMNEKIVPTKKLLELVEGINNIEVFVNRCVSANTY